MKKDELVAFIKEARASRTKNPPKKKHSSRSNDKIGAQDQDPRTEGLERAGAGIQEKQKANCCGIRSAS